MMKQLYSDLKKILFGAALVLAALGWFNAAHATRGLDTIMGRYAAPVTTEAVVAGGSLATPESDDSAPRYDRIAELLTENPQTYHSTVRVLPHQVYGMTAAQAKAAYEAHRKTRQCDWLELGCFVDREVGL